MDKAKVVGNTNVQSTNSTILNNIYGGGNEAAIEGNTNVLVSESNISYNVFGGGNYGIIGSSQRRCYRKANSYI